MASLQNICRLITDGKHGDCQNEDGSGFYFISCKDVKDGWVDYSNCRQITEADFQDTHRRTQLEPYDILITNSGTIGRMALVPLIPETTRTTFQKSVAIVKPDATKIMPKWLYYCLKARKDALIAYAGGTAQKNLLLRDLRAFEIDIPPLPIQYRIASILSAYDDLIENNTRRIAILEEMARRIYEEWFVKFKFPGYEKVKMVDSELMKIPEGWEARVLGDLTSDIRQSIQPNMVDPETPYVGLEHIPRRSIALSEWGKATDVQSTKIIFQERDILFGKIRPYFHKVAVAPIGGVTSSDSIVIRTLNQDFYPIVLATISSDAFVAYATQTSNGTKMPRANWNVLTQYAIAIPPNPLLGRFNSFINNVVTAVKNFTLRNRNLRTTRDFLLPKLISGEIDVSKLPEPEEATT